MGRGVHSAVCPSVPSEVPGPEVTAQGQQRWAGRPGRHQAGTTHGGSRAEEPAGSAGALLWKDRKKKIINYLQMHILEYL